MAKIKRALGSNDKVIIQWELFTDKSAEFIRMYCSTNDFGWDRELFWNGKRTLTIHRETSPILPSFKNNEKSYNHLALWSYTTPICALIVIGGNVHHIKTNRKYSVTTSSQVSHLNVPSSYYAHDLEDLLNGNFGNAHEDLMEELNILYARIKSGRASYANLTRIKSVQDQVQDNNDLVDLLSLDEQYLISIPDDVKEVIDIVHAKAKLNGVSV